MTISPPRPKSPPLNALRAFESAARLGGFANAAEELCVTAGAISQHIKALEDWLGAELFRRRSQGVELSDFGAAVAPDLIAAFDALGQAVHHLRARSGQQKVHIAALPSIAQLWLSPRLPAIRTNLPEIGLSVSAVETPPNLAREMFDLSIFLRPVSEMPNQIMLDEDRIYPVCAPALAKTLRNPEDLKNAPLLHDTSWAEDWGHWANSILGSSDGFDRGAQYSLYSIALEETRNGAGVLIGHDCLVRPAIERGELVAPFDLPVLTGKALVLETAGFGRVSDAVCCVRDRLVR